MSSSLSLYIYMYIYIEGPAATVAIMSYLIWYCSMVTVACYESQPGSWLVAICERSENRGSGGGSCQTGQKSGK